MTWDEAKVELEKGNGVRRPGWGARYIVWTQGKYKAQYMMGFARPVQHPLLKAEDYAATDFDVVFGVEVAQ